MRSPISILFSRYLKHISWAVSLPPGLPHGGEGREGTGSSQGMPAPISEPPSWFLSSLMKSSWWCPCDAAGAWDEREMSNCCREKKENKTNPKNTTKPNPKSKMKQEVIYLDPFSPIKPWEADGRSGKTELSLQEIKHEMKTSLSYSVLSSQAPISHSRPLIKWCPVSVLKDEFWLCSCRLVAIPRKREDKTFAEGWSSGARQAGRGWAEGRERQGWKAEIERTSPSSLGWGE